jgi:hypothetical protein
MVHSLNLPTDVQLGSIEIDQLPREPEYFALAQAQDQNERDRLPAFGHGWPCPLVLFAQPAESSAHVLTVTPACASTRRRSAA